MANDSDFLKDFIDHFKPVHKHDRGYDYYYRNVVIAGEHQHIEVSKMNGSQFITAYWITKRGGHLLCNCPAGHRGVWCKHREWLKTLSLPT